MRTYPLLAAALFITLGAAAASVDGAKIHSTTYGNGPKTVIFVHGWTCDESSWSEQVPVFKKDYRVITVDLPGHGQSESPKGQPLTMDLFARALEAVRAEAKADKIVLVGHSMGATVITQYAASYPQHVAALVPVDGSLTLSGNKSPSDSMKGEQGLKTRQSSIRGMTTSATPAVQERVMKMMMGASEKTAVEAMDSMFGPSKPVGPFPFPALGIYAGKRSGNLAPIMPNSRLVGIEGSGHFVMLEKPAEFNRLLGDFLASVKF